MNYIKSYLILPVTLTLIITSCKKDSTEEPNPSGSGVTCQPVENIKNYFDFKVGSWWVYEEVNSGVRDSVYVTEEWNDPNNFNFDMRVFSTYSGYFYHFWPVNASSSTNCKDVGVICDHCKNVQRSKYKPGDYKGEQPCFFFLGKPGDSESSPTIFYSNNRIKIDSINTSVNIGGFQFEEVYRISEPYTEIEAQSTIHYFAKHIGLVKKELIANNEVWILKDYFIQE